MGDHERARLGADQLVDAVGDGRSASMSSRVGLVEHGDLRLQQRHLQDLDPLLLAAGEAVVQVALREFARHLQPLHRGEDLGAELLDRDRSSLPPRVPSGSR